MIRLGKAGPGWAHPRVLGRRNGHLGGERRSVCDTMGAHGLGATGEAWRGQAKACRRRPFRA